MERGKLSFDVKGVIQVAETIRIRVPMQSSVADRLVLVMKLAKANGAKGSSYPVFTIESTKNLGGTE